MEPNQTVGRRERPLGVVVILLFVLADTVVVLAQARFDLPLTTRTSTLVDVLDWMPAIIVGLAAVRLVAAVGLWLGSRAAWVLSMLTVGVGLIINFYVYWLGDPSYGRLVVDIAIAFYLNQGVVRDYVEGREELSADPAEGVR